MQSKTRIAALAAVLAAAAVGSAFAAGAGGGNDALAVSSAGIGLGQAVATAERQVGGKASKAEYEHHKGQGVYDVEVVNGKSVTDVKVDAADGRVIEAKADRVDRDDGGDQED